MFFLTTCPVLVAASHCFNSTVSLREGISAAEGEAGRKLAAFSLYSFFLISLQTDETEKIYQRFTKTG